MVLRVVLIGKPNAGKGTVACTADQENYAVLSFSALINGEYKEEFQQRCANASASDLSPDDIVIDIMTRELAKDKYRGVPIIFDGFPRTVKQAEALPEILHKHGEKLHLVVHLKTSNETCETRAAERMVCSKCKTPYAIPVSEQSSAPPCTHNGCGSPLIRREEDDPVQVKKRLKDFEDLTQPVVDFYSKQTDIFFEIEADNLQPDVVNAMVQSKISTVHNEHFCKDEIRQGYRPDPNDELPDFGIKQYRSPLPRGAGRNLGFNADFWGHKGAALGSQTRRSYALGLH